MTEEYKTHLFEKGYVVFNLYDLKDNDINNALDELYLMSNKEFKTLRYKKISTSDNISIKDSFENLESIKESIKKDNLYEIWYANPVYPKDKFNKQLLNKIKNYFYSENVDEIIHSSNISMYNDGCFLVEHVDGFNPNSKYKCVILIYLNKEDEIKEGGELLVDKKLKVKPIIGTVAMLDFTKNDISHGVSKVSGYQRKCFINFC